MDVGGLAVVALFALSGAAAGYGARVLVGRLRRGARIGAGWCEVVLAVLWSVTGAGWVFGASPGRWVPVLLGLGWLAVAAGAVDVRCRRLPDALTVPAMPAALLLLVPLGWPAVLRGIGGAALAAVAYGTVHALRPHALGAGDVKLAGPLGAVLAAGSWTAVLLAALLSAVITAVLAAASSIAVASPPAGRARCPPCGAACRAACSGCRAVSPPSPPSLPSRPNSVPHGPSMLAAAWLVSTGLVSTGLAAGAPLGVGGGG